MKIKQRLLEHIVDSTAMLSLTNPVSAVIETTFAGMSNDVSINARVLGTGLTFIGLGTLYGKGRDLSKRVFKITEKTSEKVKQIHDIVYSVGYLLATTPLFYYAAGSRDTKEIAVGTAMAAVSGLIGGGVLGYTVDLYRDLTGLKESERVPNLLKSQNPAMKKTIAAALTITSAGLMAAIYSFTK